MFRDARMCLRERFICYIQVTVYVTAKYGSNEVSNTSLYDTFGFISLQMTLDISIT